MRPNPALISTETAPIRITMLANAPQHKSPRAQVGPAPTVRAGLASSAASTNSETRSRRYCGSRRTLAETVRSPGLFIGQSFFVRHDKQREPARSRSQERASCSGYGAPEGSGPDHVCHSRGVPFCMSSRTPMVSTMRSISTLLSSAESVSVTTRICSGTSAMYASYRF